MGFVMVLKAGQWTSQTDGHWPDGRGRAWVSGKFMAASQLQVTVGILRGRAKNLWTIERFIEFMLICILTCYTTSPLEANYCSLDAPYNQQISWNDVNVQFKPIHSRTLINCIIYVQNRESLLSQIDWLIANAPLSWLGSKLKFVVDVSCGTKVQ